MIILAVRDENVGVVEGVCRGDAGVLFGESKIDLKKSRMLLGLKDLARAKPRARLGLPKIRSNQITITQSAIALRKIIESCLQRH